MKKLLYFLPIFFSVSCILSDTTNVKNTEPVTNTKPSIENSGPRQQTNPLTPPRPTGSETLPSAIITIDFNQPMDQVVHQVKQAKMKMFILDSFIDNFAQVLKESADMKAKEQQLYTNYYNYLTYQKQLASMGPQNFQAKYGFTIDQAKDKYIQMLPSLSPAGQEAFKYAKIINESFMEEGFVGGISPKVTAFVDFVQKQLASTNK